MLSFQNSTLVNKPPHQPSYLSSNFKYHDDTRTYTLNVFIPQISSDKRGPSCYTSEKVNILISSTPDLQNSNFFLYRTSESSSFEQLTSPTILTERGKSYRYYMTAIVADETAKNITNLSQITLTLTNAQYTKEIVFSNLVSYNEGSVAVCQTS